MPVELEQLFYAIEGGKAVTGQVIPFPTDAGATALEGITETVELGNGVATEVSQLTAVEGGATTTAGVGMLAVDVGVAGAAIAPALGIAAGVGLYSLAPNFWDGVAEELISAGETVNGKVRAFLQNFDGSYKAVGFTEGTIEIMKNAFIRAGIFEGSVSVDDTTFPNFYTPISEVLCGELAIDGAKSQIIQRLEQRFPEFSTNAETIATYLINRGKSISSPNANAICRLSIQLPWDGGNSGQVSFHKSTSLPDNIKTVNDGNTHYYAQISNPVFEDITYFNFDIGTTLLRSGYAWIIEGIFQVQVQTGTETHSGTQTYNLFSNTNGFPVFIEYIKATLTNPLNVINLYNFGILAYKNLQPDADYPEEDEPFPLTYPTWTPYELPDEITKVYPLTMPVIDPAPLQAPAQNPASLPDNNPDLLSWLIDAMNLPKANPEIEPAPLPAIDPDPQPSADPIEEPTKPNTKPDPVDPNPEPTTPFLPIVPQLPDTVPANAMFTVYKPTIAQVNAFGGWLWSNSILEMIKRIWQNPLDGIIAFMKVYVDAPTSGNDTIKVGVLDSEVSSAVVSGQFVTVDCGSIDIEEKFFNATDYSPFVSLHLYLPFIGIVELDSDEFMGGSIKVTYHVDVYTGTCLAEVKAKRNHDMDNYTIVYTFSGNASQQLPLTSAEFGGALSALVGVVGGGLAIASGGGLGLLAGASGIAHAVTHEMVHLAHSGSLSANAGIMGARTPYLILTRRRGYDANGYNQIYGYPANKTVYLNNCSGLVKVKDIQLKTGATDLEANEIVSLLKEGVIV